MTNPGRRRRVLTAGVLVATLLAPAAAIGASTRRAPRVGNREAAAPARTATTHFDGLTLKLAVHPDPARHGRPVTITLAASASHATGALVRAVSYGDGHSAPPVMVPQYCLAMPGRTARQTWTFSHAYLRAGTYRIVASASVNCGGGDAQVQLTVHVR